MEHLFKLTGKNVKIEIRSYGIYVDGKDLGDMVREKLGDKTLLGNITLTIAEVESKIEIEGEDQQCQD